MAETVPIEQGQTTICLGAAEPEATRRLCRAGVQAGLAAAAVAERIREAVAEKPFLLAGGKHTINMTISIGIASLRLMGGDTAEALFSRTDAALYEAKKNGRNRIVLSAA